MKACASMLAVNILSDSMEMNLYSNTECRKVYVHFHGNHVSEEAWSAP